MITDSAQSRKSLERNFLVERRPSLGTPAIGRDSVDSGINPRDPRDGRDHIP